MLISICANAAAALPQTLERLFFSNEGDPHERVAAFPLINSLSDTDQAMIVSAFASRLPALSIMEFGFNSTFRIVQERDDGRTFAVAPEDSFGLAMHTGRLIQVCENYRNVWRHVSNSFDEQGGWISEICSDPSFVAWERQEDGSLVMRREGFALRIS